MKKWSLIIFSGIAFVLVNLFFLNLVSSNKYQKYESFLIKLGKFSQTNNYINEQIYRQQSTNIIASYDPLVIASSELNKLIINLKTEIAENTGLFSKELESIGNDILNKNNSIEIFKSINSIKRNSLKSILFLNSKHQGNKIDHKNLVTLERDLMAFTLNPTSNEATNLLKRIDELDNHKGEGTSSGKIWMNHAKKVIESSLKLMHVNESILNIPITEKAQKLENEISILTSEYLNNLKYSIYFFIVLDIFFFILFALVLIRLKNKTIEVNNLNYELEYKVKQRTQELKKSLLVAESTNKQLSHIQLALDNASIVASTDAKGTITYVNDKLCEVSKYSREELIGQNHRMLNSGFHSTEFFKEMYQNIASGKTWSAQIKNKAKDGSFYWVQTSITPEMDKNNKPISYTAIRHEITDLMHALNDIKKHSSIIEQRNKDLDEFSYVVSHDLKAPLRAISTLSTFLEEDIEDDIKRPLSDAIKKQFKLIRQRSERMKYLIQDVLAYSKVGREAVNKEEVDLQNLFELIIAETPQYDERNIKINILNELPTVLIEQVFVQQIFANLLSNSVKYHNKENGKVDVFYENKKDSFVITIKDDGPGIEKEYQEKVFKIFQTIEKTDTPESTGVGLSTVKKLVESMGGSINLRSVYGEGCEFIVELPIVH